MPPLIVTESPYQFVPPHEGNLWPRMLAGFATRMIRKRYAITEVEIRDQDRLAELLRHGHGILLAPNHCRMSDPMALQSLSKSLKQPFFVMASSHLFRASKFTRFILRRIGAFSIYREGVDRQAIETAIDILAKGKRPLVMFPEGALSQANDRLNALMDGVSFVARSAARKIEKQNAGADSIRQVYIVPVAIRYLFQADIHEAVDPILTDIEKRLTWRPQPDRSLMERLLKVGEALLGLKETEYLGLPAKGKISERLQKLIDAILVPLEQEWLNGRTEISAINRVKELRKAVVPAMIQNANNDGEKSVPLSQSELDRRWRQLQDMELAQALSLFPEDYVVSKPTVDRFLESVERIAESLSGEEQVHGPMKVVIRIGEPFAVSAKRDRGADGDPVLNRLEACLASMLDELSNECRPLTNGSKV